MHKDINPPNRYLTVKRFFQYRFDLVYEMPEKSCRCDGHASNLVRIERHQDGLMRACYVCDLEDLGDAEQKPIEKALINSQNTK